MSFLQVDATLFKIFLIRVNIAKRNVENTVRQLENLRSDVVQEVDLIVTKKWWELLEKHRNHVNLVLEAIRVTYTYINLLDTHIHTYALNEFYLSKKIYFSTFFL